MPLPICALGPWSGNATHEFAWLTELDTLAAILPWEARDRKRFAFICATTGLNGNAFLTILSCDDNKVTSTPSGRPYRFSSADQLLADFFAEVRRVLDERGVDDTVVATTDKGEKP